MKTYTTYLSDGEKHRVTVPEDEPRPRPIPGAFHGLATNGQMRMVCFHERAARAYEQLAKDPTVSKKERARCRENAKQAREMADKVGA